MAVRYGTLESRFTVEFVKVVETSLYLFEDLPMG